MINKRYKNLSMSLEDSLAIVKINRLKVKNALNLETWQELLSIFTEIDKNNSIKVVILTGAGEEAFVSGADINWLHSRDPKDMYDFSTQDVCNAIADCSKPVIAAVNGYALGGGCELALACDIRYASDDAVFGQPEVRLGILPAAGGTQRLTQLVGIGKAKEMIFSGQFIKATEASQIGLVNKVVPKKDLLNESLQLAKEIMKNAPLAVQKSKRVINQGATQGFTAGLAGEIYAQSYLYGTADKQEGMQAFIEKRHPVFKGE